MARKPPETQCRVCGADRMPHNGMVLCEKHFKAYMVQVSMKSQRLRKAKLKAEAEAMKK